VQQLSLFPRTDALEPLYATLQALERGQVARTTLAGYAHDWRAFCAFCEGLRRPSLPAHADTLSLFLADQIRQGKRANTVNRQAAAVAWQHRQQGFPSPLTAVVRQALAGARRLDCGPLHQMRPLSVAQIRQIARGLDRAGTSAALRDRALLTLGFASALRRANLAALALADVRFCAQGLTIQVHREKQDQAGHGRLIAVPFGRHAPSCPVRALRAWIARRGSAAGPLFTRLDPARNSEVQPLSVGAVYTIVKRAVARIGLDARLYGPHSLRAGLISAAGQAGVNPLVIACQSGHRSLNSLQDYYRPVDLFRANACAQIGL